MKNRPNAAEPRLLAPGSGEEKVSTFGNRTGLKLEKVCRSCRKKRRGVAVVEFAIVAPVFFLLVFGMIEFGRMIMVQQVITNASREGAHLTVLDGVTTANVQTTVNNYLGNASISGATTTVTTAAPVAPDYADSMTVNVRIGFSQVSWLP